MKPFERWTPVAAWALLALVTLATRFPLAIDETRYLTVAWEMVAGGDWLVPHLNGAPYSHKPPLLFWAIAAGWKVVGVNDWWPRLLMLATSVAGLALVAALARRLWPQAAGAARHAVLITGGMLAWVAYSTFILFDLLLAVWVLCGLLGLAQAANGERRGWVLFGVACGLGILTKGPVALLQLLPPALLGPWWSDTARKATGAWYARLAAATALGLCLALAWVIPAAYSGGDAYAERILWSQTADRVVASFSHDRPPWWYLVVLPLMLLPWVAWPPFWHALGRALAGADAGTRLCVAAVAPAFIVFSVISGKQPHYLLPLLPAIALVAARGLLPAAGTSGDGKVRGLLSLHAMSVAGLAVLLAALSLSPRARSYGVEDVAREVRDLRAQGVPVAYYGTYHGQLGYAARLAEPMVELHRHRQLTAVAAAAPDTRVIVTSRKDPAAVAGDTPVRVFGYRNGYWSIWPADRLAADPGVLDDIGVRDLGAGKRRQSR